MTKAKKKEYNLTTAQANDYRMGLVNAVSVKIEEDAEEFFSEQEKKYEIVPIDDRIERAKKMLNQKVARTKIKQRRSDALLSGEKDGEKIVISKGVSGKQDEVKMIG